MSRTAFFNTAVERIGLPALSFCAASSKEENSFLRKGASIMPYSLSNTLQMSWYFIAEIPEAIRAPTDDPAIILGSKSHS